MSNDYYNGGSVPAPNAPGASGAIRAEFLFVTAAFDKLPALTGNGGKIVAVNALGTGLTATSSAAGLSLTNPTISGGTINNTLIGDSVPAPGAFTSLSGSTVAFTGGAINNVAIGGVTPAAGAFTSLSATSGTIGGANIVTVSGSQTLTGKTINLSSNTLVATSAQLAAALTDETGSGSAVFADSPALTGTPTAPTATTGNSTTQIATTAFVSATAFSAALPSQAGNAGKFVTTDGFNASWASIDLAASVVGVLPPANGGFDVGLSYFFASF